MNIINDEVGKVMKEPLMEPQKPKAESVKRPYRTAMSTDEEIDEILFVQDDIKRMERQEKNKPKKL